MLRGAIVIVYIYNSPCFAWMLHYTNHFDEVMWIMSWHLVVNGNYRCKCSRFISILDERRVLTINSRNRSLNFASR